MRDSGDYLKGAGVKCGTDYEPEKPKKQSPRTQEFPDRAEQDLSTNLDQTHLSCF